VTLARRATVNPDSAKRGILRGDSRARARGDDCRVKGMKVPRDLRRILLAFPREEGIHQKSTESAEICRIMEKYIYIYIYIYIGLRMM